MRRLHPFSKSNAPQMYFVFYKECDELGEHVCGLEWRGLKQKLLNKGVPKKIAVEVEEIFHNIVYNLSEEKNVRLSKQFELHKIRRDFIILAACFDYFLEGNIYYLLKPFLPLHQDLEYNLETVNTLLSPYADELAAYDLFIYGSVEMTKTGLDLAFHNSFKDSLPPTDKTELVKKEYHNIIRRFEENRLSNLIYVIEDFNSIFTEWQGEEWEDYLRRRGVKIIK